MGVTISKSHTVDPYAKVQFNYTLGPLELGYRLKKVYAGLGVYM